MAERGKFITLEGVDGCGKSTQARLLAEALRARGMDVVLTREPGGTAAGRKISELVQSPESGRLEAATELALMFAARAQHLAEVIRPALAAGQHVVCDRYGDSTVAYQGYGRGADLKSIRELDRILCGGEKPDLTLVLDVDPRTGAQRTAERNESAGQGTSRFEMEGENFFRKVREGYRAVAAAEPQRVKEIDGSGTVAQVQERVLGEVARLLGLKAEAARDGV